MSDAFHRYHFTGQREKEEVIEVIHRHWFNILSHFFLLVIFSFLLIASPLILTVFFPDLLSSEQGLFFLFLENTFFIFIWLFGFLLWIDYYFDVWIITNERIIDIEQKGLFNRHVSELNFSNIQDVTITVEGIIPTMLNYGEVFIQTAAEQERFRFHMVPDPYRIKDVIMKISEHSHIATGLR